MKKFLLAVSLLALAGCASADHKASEVQIPGSWTNTAAPVNDAAAQLRWWEQFNDPTLNNLVQTAAQQNLDLKIAKTRIRAARAQLLATRASFLPDINASASAGRTRGSTRTGLGAAGGGERDLYDVGLDATWEFNIFGIGPAIEAADATLKAETENQHSVMLTMLGEVAQNYIELRRLQNSLAVTDQSIAAFKTSLDLTDARLKAGLTSGLDSSRAETALQTQMAERPEIVTQINAAVRRIEVLLGQNPGTLDAQLGTPAAIPVAGAPLLLATPVAVIANRPDVRAAEQTLIASNATKRVATAQYFPSISLPAAFGWQADNGSGIFSSGGQAWSFAGVVKLPIFDFGRIRSDVQLSDANAEAAFLGYEKSVKTALSDVETALSDYLASVNRSAQLNRAVQTSQTTVDLSDTRYRNGLVSYLDVAEAQKSLYGAQQAAIQNTANAASRLITLYKAMGGGWQDSGAAPIVASPAPVQQVPTLAPQPVPVAAPLPNSNVTAPADTRSNAPRVGNNGGSVVIE